MNLARSEGLTHCPGTVFHFDFFAQLAFDDGFLAFQGNAEFLFLQDDHEISGSRSLGHRHHDIKFTKFLSPCVGQSYIDYNAWRSEIDVLERTKAYQPALRVLAPCLACRGRRALPWKACRSRLPRWPSIAQVKRWWMLSVNFRCYNR